MQAPFAPQVCGAVQLPQVPPQPSGPHCFPLHWRSHMQLPAAVQVWPALHVPQLPPQPLSPQVLPVQLGEQLL